jgi:methylmalonyl-CoA mutase N-terminal domain/subunit
MTHQDHRDDKTVYTREDLAGFDVERALGFPGQFPFTRGIQPTM